MLEGEEFGFVVLDGLFEGGDLGGEDSVGLLEAEIEGVGFDDLVGVFLGEEFVKLGEVGDL